MYAKIRYFSYLYYRVTRRLINHYRLFVLGWLRLWYRFIRRVVNHYRQMVFYLMSIRWRFMRQVRFRTLRLLVFFMWRLWLRRVDGFENIPTREPAIIVSNHLSYYDFFVLASVLKKQTVFVAAKGLNQRSFVGWFMKLDTILYVDRDKPGYGVFKQLMSHLKFRKLIVLYPEATRSRSGKMLAPKSGFVKLAMKANVPVIPIAMKGTYDILPPHKRVPSLKKCDVIIGKKIYISPSTPLLRDIFFRRRGQRRFDVLQESELSEIAFRVMNQVRLMADEAWDESAKLLAQKLGVGENNLSSLEVSR